MSTQPSLVTQLHVGRIHWVGSAVRTNTATVKVLQLWTLILIRSGGQTLLD